jgi:hypothetical protein
MPKGLLFWIIYVVCLVIWLAVDFGGIGGPYVGHLAGGSVIEFILIGLLGWGVFGAPIQ